MAAVKELTALLQQGSITRQIYAEGLAAIKTQKQRERPTPAPALHDVVQNILDEPISEEVKAIAEALTSTKPSTCPTITPK